MEAVKGTKMQDDSSSVRNNATALGEKSASSATQLPGSIWLLSHNLTPVLDTREKPMKAVGSVAPNDRIDARIFAEGVEQEIDGH